VQLEQAMVVVVDDVWVTVEEPAVEVEVLAELIVETVVTPEGMGYSAEYDLPDAVRTFTMIVPPLYL
jgi:hypothetical protein